MNKQQLISKISEVTGFTKKDSEIFAGAFTEIIMESVASGEGVKIVGFGNWEKKPTKGAEGIIQFGERKGEKWVTEDSFRVSFSPSKIFKEKVKE